MRFLVDESTGAAVAGAIRTMGHDVVEVAALLPSTDDELVLQLAVRENRIILTNDKDFGEMIYKSQMPHRGVVLFRLTDQRPAARIAMARMAISEYRERLEDAFTVVTEKSIRIRKR